MRFLIRFLSPSLVYTLVQLFQGQTYIKKKMSQQVLEACDDECPYLQRGISSFY